MSRTRTPVKFIDRLDIGLGSSVVVSFVIIVISVLFFSMSEKFGMALFLGHCLFLFVTGTGLYEDLFDPQDYPETHFENGYILGSALTILLVTLAEFSLSLYFKAQIGSQFGLF